jgi:hypothetical protein
MSHEVSATDVAEEAEQGRVALWLDPDDLRYLASHCCCAEDTPQEQREQCARIRFRAHAAAHKAGLKDRNRIVVDNYSLTVNRPPSSMSYDLTFWRYRPGVRLDHQKVYEELRDGNAVEGLEDLPIDAFLKRVEVRFADWERLDDLTFEGGGRGGFQLYTTPQLFRVDCYGMDGVDMNKFIDIAHEFGCPLYDPQVGKRFEGEP